MKASAEESSRDSRQPTLYRGREAAGMLLLILLTQEISLFLHEHHPSNIFLTQMMLIIKDRKALCIPP